MSSRPFLPQLESLRGVAAIGVLITHVSFQTGIDPATHIGGFLTRFDFFVSVFFGLSGFLLWRSGNFSFKRYYSRRFWRIVPAYWVCVLLTLVFVPVAYRASPLTVLSTLTFTQMYVPNGYHGGLTHLWSLCVEVAFYLVVPFLWLLLKNLSAVQRILAIIILALLTLGWAFLPLVNLEPTADWPNMQIFPPAFFAWFAVGMIAAELEGLGIELKESGFLSSVLHSLRRRLRLPSRTVAIGRRWPWWLAAAFFMWLAGQDFYGPVGLVHPKPHEFALRIIAGTLTCACLLLPYALNNSPSLLDSVWFRKLGKISYSVFLWHIPVLSIMFPLTGIRTFSGGFWVILILTLAVSVVVSWCSYVLVEQPFRSFTATKTELLQRLR